MGKTNKLRVTVAAKFLVMFLSVALVADVVIGVVAYKVASDGLTNSVYEHFSARADDMVNQISAINARHLQMIRGIAAISVIKDDTVSLAEKQALLWDVPKMAGENMENIAYYDKDGNAITTDGRLLNLADRVYFRVRKP